MKATGIVRKVDELGRIVLPMELRRTLNIDTRDELEIFVDKGSIILRKYQESDVFTGATENLIEYKGKMVSIETIKELVKLADGGKK